MPKGKCKYKDEKGFCKLSWVEKDICNEDVETPTCEDYEERE